MQKIILLFLLPLFALNATAENNLSSLPGNTDSVFRLSGDSLIKYANTGGSHFFSVVFDNISPANLNQLNGSASITTFQNTVALGFKNHSAFNENVQVGIDATLSYYPVNGSAAVNQNITLGVKYQSGVLKKTDVSNTYAFANAYRVDLTVTGVTVSSSTPGVNLMVLKNKLKDFIELTVGFDAQHLTRINYLASPANITACEDKTRDELVISWSSLADAQSYELEYTFVDDYTGSYNTAANPADLTFNFKENSTRIATPETYYRFPLTYERGYILYRIRAIGLGGTHLNLPVYCQWSDVDMGIVKNFTHSFYHQATHVADKMNWQTVVSFAEDGKRSDLVNYYDGTFRSRQSVTAMNLDRQLPLNLNGTRVTRSTANACVQYGDDKEREVIAGETIYDYQGRAAVNILPAPTNSQKLTYLALLNISDNINAPNTIRKPYSWEDFDKPNALCPDTHKLFSKPDPQTGIMGAAAYYSPFNPGKEGFNAFIPDGEGYPFTQISYMADNTGRVAAQSQVGKDFQFGNGHETRFFYAAPNQEELDKMFGTEVGDALRYKKNAVRDGNGQISVSYINPEGKTIATALAGSTPVNLSPLANQNPNTISISLMNKNVLNTDDKTLITEHEFIVTADNTDYTFNYGITPQTLSDAKCNGTPVCLDCIYDISIVLTNAESCSLTPLLNYSGTIGNLLDSNGQTDLQCNNNSSTGNYPRNIIKTLGIGTYTITKKITVNKQAALAYVAEVFKDTCQAKWTELITDEINHIDTLKCYSSCSSCAQPPVKTVVCDTAYCKPAPNRCDVIRSMMLSDVTPGGQYAQYVLNADGTIDASTYPLSVFNNNNVLPAAHYPNSIDLSQFPSSITSYSDLVNNWLPEYAEKLLPMHPEYHMLGWCSSPNIDTTLDFNSAILSTNYYADALGLGYISQGYTFPNTQLRPYEQLVNKDPLFFNGLNQSLKNLLLDKLHHYGCSGSTVSIDSLAMKMAYCAVNNPPTQYQPGISPPPVIQSNNTSCTLSPDYYTTHNFGGGVDALSNLEWTFLRALYLSAKNEVLAINMSDYAAANGYNINCIGSQQPIQFFSVMQPCTSAVWFLYGDKQSRFNTGSGNIIKQLATDAHININTDSITNINDPCQLVQLITGQTASINQQANNLDCGAVADTACGISKSFVLSLNQIIRKLKDTASFIVPKKQIDLSLINAGISGFSAKRTDSTYIISFQRCRIVIPFIKTRTKSLLPMSVCCISHINCSGNSGCSFDIKVLYSDRTYRTIHLQTDCNFLSGCTYTEKKICSDPTVYATAVKNYLSDIFNYLNAYHTNPLSAQLVSMLPAALKTIDPFHVYRASITDIDTADFVIGLGYIFKDSEKGAQYCTISLQKNSKLKKWFNIRSVLSLTPDMSMAQNGNTNNFILTVLAVDAGGNVQKDTIKGKASCWVMNQCPPAKPFCDTIPALPPYTTKNSCVQNLIATATSNATLRYFSWVDSVKNDLLERYYAKCLQAVENFDLSYTDKEYRYTLYYYDQAGNLVKTVPPAGVQLLNHSQALQVAASRAAGYTTAVLPAHIKSTIYRYNTLNEITWQKTPDAGETNLFYDGLGRVVASQNAQQKTGNLFSYTRFDSLGRSVETGKLNSVVINTTLTRDFQNWTNFINNQATRTEITVTHYDEPYSTVVSNKFGNSGQQNLRMRVASTLNFDNKTTLDARHYIYASHYSYDLEGNVKKLVQDYPNGIIGDKTAEYDYDLQSAKVNQVTYQRGAADQFIHHYNYDAANLLTQVNTSTNGLVWNIDAMYKYYRHGPLARLELGTDSVQGIDYLYTLQGWAKGVNGISTNPQTDMGEDGIPVSSANVTGYRSMNTTVGRDAFGFVLDYFPGDYKAILGNHCLDGLQQHAGIVKPLYNGNISRMYTQLQSLGNNGYNYAYDQLNRIVFQQAWELNINNGHMGLLQNDAYGGSLSYDADGNIMNQVRNGKASLPAMDKLTYYYYTQNNAIYNPATGNIPADATNKLAFVKDQVGPGAYSEDIDDQRPRNYHYDLIGNLISDTAENINRIYWNLQNKVARIVKSNGQNIVFQYDAHGDRVMKEVMNTNAAQNEKTFYVHDAQGNTLAVYSYRIPPAGSTPKLYLTEAHIYGSSRIGLYLPDTLLPAVTRISSTANNSIVQGLFFERRGYRQYELTNHLHNVLATITDRKIPLAGSQGKLFTADLVSAQDYYAFGMQMPGRTNNTSAYRYSFNGQEKEKELNANVTTATFWEYDGRTGRRWNVDPAWSKYPGESSYQTFHNNPIFFSDPFGDDPPEGFMKYKGKGGDLFLPPSATLKTSSVKGKGGKIRTSIDEFTIGTKTFTASYDAKNNFTGYFNGADRYNNPDITLQAGGIVGNNLNATFHVTGVPASGLQLVQTVHKTGMDAPYQNTTIDGVTFDANGMVSGSYTYKNGKTDMQGNVDGAKGSVYALTIDRATGLRNGESFPGMPYYYSAGEAGAAVAWNKDNGTIRVTDAPNVQNLTQKATWTSMVVATNYMGTGKDVVLGTFRWGWTANGATAVHAGVSLTGNKPSSTELKTIGKFYGAYHFFK